MRLHYIIRLDSLLYNGIFRVHLIPVYIQLLILLCDAEKHVSNALENETLGTFFFYQMYQGYYHKIKMTLEA